MTGNTKIAEYLQRISVSGNIRPGSDDLARLQSAHRQSIPFENFSVRNGEGILCDSAGVFEKLVRGNRGGFCFEHNQLFADMLDALGFDVRLLLARVLLGTPPELSPRTHCLVLVRMNGEDWIADAGFGGSYAPPMSLSDGELAQSGDGAQHRLRRLGPEGALPGSWLLERRGPQGATDGRVRSDDQWEQQYAFDLAQVAPADMALGCHWSATHPASRFTNLTVVSRCLPDGFVSIVDQELSRWQQGKTPSKTAIASVSDYRAVLQQEFGIKMSGEDIARLPLF